jgi:hypothetical protein
VRVEHLHRRDEERERALVGVPVDRQDEQRAQDGPDRDARGRQLTEGDRQRGREQHQRREVEHVALVRPGGVERVQQRDAGDRDQQRQREAPGIARADELDGRPGQTDGGREEPGADDDLGEVAAPLGQQVEDIEVELVA